MALVEKFTRNIPDLGNLEYGCVNTPCHNYNPYDLFSIRTRLSPYLKRKYGRDADVLFTNVKKVDKMVLKISVYNGIEVMDLNEEQSKDLSLEIE